MAIAIPWKERVNLAYVFNLNLHYTLQPSTDEVAEWLRRWTANPLGSARVGSNPILVDKHFHIIYFYVHAGQVHTPRTNVLFARGEFWDCLLCSVLEAFLIALFWRNFQIEFESKVNWNLFSKSGDWVVKSTDHQSHGLCLCGLECSRTTTCHLFELFC